MAAVKSNLPAVIGEFAVVKADPSELGEVIRENVGNGALSQFDLDRVKVPAGGGTTWEVPSLDGIEDAKAIEGVIVYWKTVRAYWKESFEDSGGGTPPDCSSDDGETGRGDPGGECAKCPFAQFGSVQRSGKDGRGQACKQMRLLFILRKDDMLPLVLSVPPTSLKVVSRYFLRLASRGVPYHSVLTKIELAKEKNSDGLQYARIEPSMGGRLSNQEIDLMKAYRANLTPALEAVKVDHQEIADAPD